MSKSRLLPYIEDLRNLAKQGKTSTGMSEWLEENKQLSLHPRTVRDFLTKHKIKTKYTGLEIKDEISDLVKDEFNLDTAPNTGIVWLKSKNVSAQIRKQNQVSFDKMMDDFRNFALDYTPSFKKINRKPVTDPHCLVIDIADLHLGKYASELESGKGYDSETAKHRAWEGLNGLLQKSAGFNFEQIVFVIGNDVLHTDNNKRTTTGGTPQDTDKNWYENYIDARKLYIDCLDVLLEIADVHVVHCPSNHDYMSGFMLADSIYCYYHAHPNITFDVGIKHFKYYKYGNSLIGASHGDGAKTDKLPLLMAQEVPQMWADTKFRYWYLHHIHHKDKRMTQIGKDYNGVTIEFMRSPSGTDSYHHKNAYISPKAVEGKIHSKKYGQVSSLTHYFI